MGGRVGRGGGGGVRADVNEELKFFVKIQKKKNFGPGVGLGVRVDVNEEFIWGGGGGGGEGGGRVGGQGGCE